MHCTKCGQRIKNTANFCSYCGSLQLENSPGGIPDIQRIINEAKVYDSFSMVAAVCMFAATCLASYAFKITDNALTGEVFYSVGLIEIGFVVFFMSAIILVSIEKRTLLGKVVSQFGVMTIASVSIGFIGSFVLNLIVNFKDFLPKLAKENATVYIVMSFVAIALCILEIVICNYISSKRDVTQRVRYTSLTYILFGVYAGLPLHEIIQTSIEMNRYVLEDVINVSADEVNTVLGVVFISITLVSVVTVILIGLIAKKNNTRLMCAVSSGVTSLYFLVTETVGTYTALPQQGMEPVKPPAFFLLFVGFLILSVVMVILSQKRINKKI